MYVVYFGLHAWSFLNITFNVRLSGLKKMEIVFIKDCSLEKFMVSQEGKKKTNYQYLRNSFKKKEEAYNPYQFMCRTGTQHCCS